jgi:hypothetical protein
MSKEEPPGLCACVGVCVQSALSGGRSTSNAAEHAIAHFSGQISPFDEDILATRAHNNANEADIAKAPEVQTL